MLNVDQSVLMVLESIFPARGGGGAENQVANLARCMRERGIRVEVVVPLAADGPQTTNDSLDGIPVTRILFPRIRLLGAFVLLLKLAWLLFARRHEYSVIHAHIAHNMSAVCAVMGSLLGKRIVVKVAGLWEMQGGILDPRQSLAVRLRALAIRRASLMQATSGRIRSMLIDRGFDAARIVLLPNGVDVQHFFHAGSNEILRREICGQAQFVAIFTGRLMPEKGHAMLLDAWAMAYHGRSDVTLVLIGEGKLRKSLTEKAERLGIQSQIVFLGHRDDVSPYLAIANLGLLTSHGEGLSNALLEYMAAGLPVIGTRVSGTEDFVIPGVTGWLFQPGQTAQLAKCLALATSVGNETLLAMGREARRRIVDAASLEAVTRKLFECYGFTQVSEFKIA